MLCSHANQSGRDPATCLTKANKGTCCYPKRSKNLQFTTNPKVTIEVAPAANTALVYLLTLNNPTVSFPNRCTFRGKFQGRYSGLSLPLQAKCAQQGDGTCFHSSALALPTVQRASPWHQRGQSTLEYLDPILVPIWGTTLFRSLALTMGAGCFDNLAP